MSEPTRIRVRIYGDVQGVFFRDSCREQTTGLDVSGWVRNADDGSVEAVFEGDPNDVDAMVAWCRTGPPLARVERVETTTERPTGEQGFRVTG
jgi:acylphosphatase